MRIPSRSHTPLHQITLSHDSTDERSRVYFASDMHFGSRYHRDPRAVERSFVSWLRHIAPTARALILVGDIFDYWFEYRTVVPRGFTRLIGALGELSDSGVEVHLFTGNHDVWMFDYLSTEIGCTIHRGATLFDISGTRFYVAHGDEFVRSNPLFSLIRTIFHSRVCQLLYAAIHPRWTVGFAQAWSLHSRRRGVRSYEQRPTPTDLSSEYLYQHSMEYVRRCTEMEESAPHYFVYGHRHLWIRADVAGATMVILGDWISYFSYAVWDGQRLDLQQWPSPYAEP